MTPDRWMALQSVFDRISDLPREERDRALKESCPDPEMERELRELFAELEQAQSWLEVPAPAALALRRSTDEDERPRFEPGELIANRFRIIGLLGRGGMGEVYECADQAAAGEPDDPGSRVALKTLRAALASDARAIVRFRQELFHARQVTHPNVCRLHEIFVEKDSAGRPLLFFTMELLRGDTLAELLSKGKPAIAAEEALRFAAQIAAGLDAAHTAGVIHRDIKPGNVIVCGEAPNRRAVITDFGLARADSTQSESASRSVIGTLAYMAPEQLRGEVVTRVADIYSFGLVAGEMLFGKRLADSVQSPPHSVEAVWASAIRRATSPIPAARYRTAAQFVEALASPPSRFPASLTSRRVAIGGGAAAAIAGGAAAWWWNPFSGPGPRPKTVGLAILPVDCTQPGHEHLQQAATNSLISHFRRLPGFEVPGPATVSPYAGKAQPARTIAKALKVDWLMMGAVEPIPGSQRRFVLSARLISADGSPGPWQDRVEGGFEELEKVCARAASEAATALSPALAQVNLAPGPTGNNAEAYDLYLRARYLWNRRQRNDLLEARRLAERAVELDPSFALGYCVLADTLSVLGDYGQLPPADVLPLAKQAALRAVSLNSEIADSHVSFAFATFTNDFDWSAAQRSYARALELDPHHSQAHQWYATLLVRLNRADDCLKHAREAIRLDAGSLPAHRNLATMLYFLRRYPDAMIQANHVQGISPGFFGCRELLAESHARMGQRETALFLVREMLDDPRTPGFTQAYVATTYAILGMSAECEAFLRRLHSRLTSYQPVHLARAYAELGRVSDCLHWLDLAYERRDTGLQILTFHESFDKMRSDPSFQRFVSQLRIVYPAKVDSA